MIPINSNCLFIWLWYYRPCFIECYKKLKSLKKGWFFLSKTKSKNSEIPLIQNFLQPHLSLLCFFHIGRTISEYIYKHTLNLRLTFSMIVKLMGLFWKIIIGVKTEKGNSVNRKCGKARNFFDSILYNDFIIYSFFFWGGGNGISGKFLKRK